MEGLHQPRPCGCKGIRTCLACERQGTSAAPPATSWNLEALWRYCYLCGKVQPPHHDPGVQVSSSGCCPVVHDNGGFLLPGILVIPDFISEEEELKMVRIIDESPWKPSQSGRHKQDYGPKPNFKRRKVKMGGFTGLPHFSEPLVARMVELESLQDFVPVEQCHLDYRPDRGSAIDLHFDDFWLWGDRLVTINLLSDTFLLLKQAAQGAENGWEAGLSCIADEYENSQVDSSSETHRSETVSSRTLAVDELLIPMPRRSLLVLSADARYKWQHAIPREAITSRRIAVTLRELTPEFLPGGAKETLGKELLDIALTYKGSVVQ
ncbi:alpha-ketoglutarate-dependent dioxygenase alkB homolog 4-like [Diadema antillarum]|uniref:alpha-ketoglutarate-dependent dioxygenase alkB homolog 4-like n=1 Tax=Diadema antillarum TaxID=105358 RepID=UPI003A86CB06